MRKLLKLLIAILCVIIRQIFKEINDLLPNDDCASSSSAMEALTKPRPLFFPLLDKSGDDDVDKSDRPAGRPSDRPSNPSPCESLAC